MSSIVGGHYHPDSSSCTKHNTINTVNLISVKWCWDVYSSLACYVGVLLQYNLQVITVHVW